MFSSFMPNGAGVSSIILDLALERNKSPFVLRWDIVQGWVLLQKKLNHHGGMSPVYYDDYFYLGASHDRAKVLEAYNIHVRQWQEHGHIKRTVEKGK